MQLAIIFIIDKSAAYFLDLLMNCVTVGKGAQDTARKKNTSKLRKSLIQFDNTFTVNIHKTNK